MVECQHYRCVSDVGDTSIESKRKRITPLIFLIIYIYTVLWFTVLKRSTGYHVAQFELFWSYKKWLAGDVNLGNEIMANVAMFIPFGFLLSAVLPHSSRFRGGKKVAVIIAAALAFSLLIETLQLLLMRGLFEWDDLISNGAGAVIGVAIYSLLGKPLKEKHRNRVILSVCMFFTIICFFVFISGGNIDLEADTTSRAYCFQVDSVKRNVGEIELSGFAFRYDYADGKPVLTLRSKDGEVKLTMEYGQPRPDVNDYFFCNRNYTDCGFTARGQADSETEYEIFIRWPWSPEVSTGVFIGHDGIHYSSDDTFTAPEIEGAPGLKKIIEEGTLRVYRPDYHCWVYQLGWFLYWIAEPGFSFEEDGTTRIQYQMWTTQTERLPEKRLAHGNLWDNISGHFEKYEMKGDFGPYRVMKREIPTAYSVTSIVTGYYQNGEWIWKNYFRPVYCF